MTRAALVAVALVAVVWALLHAGWYRHRQIVDYAVYEAYGASIVHGHQVPYRDFAVEYPPGALPVFVVPSLLDRFGYRRVFRFLMEVCAAAAAVGALLAGGRRAAWLTALAPLALGSVVLSRFDFWPAALAVLGLAAALRRRPVLSGGLLGTAFAAKLWPALLAPLVVTWLVRAHGERAAARWLAAAVATAAAWFLPFVALSPGGVAHSFHAQLARPLQVESLGAALLIAAHHLFSTSLSVTTSFGSQNVTGSGVRAVTIATTLAGGLALAWLYVRFARGRASADDLVVHCAAVVAVAIGLGKVFSPQFLIWLIPLVPLVRGRRALVCVPLFLAALVLTQSWFPRHYWALVNGFPARQSAELLARDLSVVALAAALVWPATRAGRARSAAPRRARPR